jgi:hypothetical protein
LDPLVCMLSPKSSNLLFTVRRLFAEDSSLD